MFKLILPQTLRYKFGEIMNDIILTPEELWANYSVICNKAAQAAEKFGRNPSEVTVLAVSKTHPTDTVINAYKGGIRAFGENYAQEIKTKNEELQSYPDIKPEWHFIGHLQTNKVKYLAPFVSMIHSVDSSKLAEEISRQAERFERTIDVLLQVNTSGEISKSGCSPENAVDIAKSFLELPNIKLRGLMTIGTFSDDEMLIRKEFNMLRMLLDKINSECGLELKDLSMGMTHDYEIAVELGATFVRVGTAIFGARDYSL